MCHDNFKTVKIVSRLKAAKDIMTVSRLISAPSVDHPSTVKQDELRGSVSLRRTLRSKDLKYAIRELWNKEVKQETFKVK